MNSIVNIISDKNEPRLKYVLDVIFNIHLGIPYKLFSNDEGLPADAFKIYYLPKKSNGNGIHIYQHHLISENVIYAHDINVETGTRLPYFFQSSTFKGDYHFDLFAVLFYLLSRYEEYLRFSPDKHGRFSSYQSLAFRNGFLKVPLVDLWILDLKKKLESKWKVFIPLQRQFKIEPTFDIDTPYAYLNRPLYLHIAATLRDVFLLRGSRLKLRLLTLIGQRLDVFDTYELFFSKLKKYEHYPIIFFLTQFKLPHDQNFSVNSKAFKQLAQRIAKQYPIGIHPSLLSQRKLSIWEKEKAILATFTNKSITQSRQHFLHLKFPQTYQDLIKGGISDDYSMIYHDHSGFRASTSVPYPWYDLKNEIITDLTIHSSVIMDATMRYYMNLDVKKAQEEAMNMKEKVKEVEGVFSFIWHNSSFAEIYGWAEWEEVLGECLAVTT
ncbi:MAG: polysaccharide deacetylase family protein [Saprospiraceae bacterium]